MTEKKECKLLYKLTFNSNLISLQTEHYRQYDTIKWKYWNRYIEV